MRALDSIAPIIINLFYIGLVFVMVRYMFLSYFFTLRKNELTKINSKISTLKLKLKTQINKRFNQADFVSEYMLNELAKGSTQRITELEFKSPEDYQTLISKIAEVIRNANSVQIIQNSKSESQVDSNMSPAPEISNILNHYQQIFNFDKALISSVIEIVRLTEEYIIKANDFNKFTEYEKRQKKIESIPEPIVITNFFTLEEIYRKHQDHRRAELEVKNQELLLPDTDTNTDPDSDENKKAG